IPDPPKYRDWREMLDRHGKEIDAVVIATPDHNHAIPALACMQLGKHVYVEKPLTHTIQESRILTRASQRYYVQTQMGNQGRSGNGVRDLYEAIWSGAIGRIREVHCQTNRPIWPQGFKEALPAQPVPETMSWNLWIGPAPTRPYNEGYAPDNWRGWWDFGCGALGDMGCHIMDPAYSVLQLGAPYSVECVEQEGNSDQSAPNKSHIVYKFPTRTVNGESQPAVTLHWRDGGLTTPRPEDVPEDEPIHDTLFVGEKGYMTCKTYGGEPTLLPKKEFEGYETPPQTQERIPDEDHRGNWLNAIRTGKPAGSNFSYAGPFSEVVLLGNLAVRSSGRLYWDSEKMEVTNNKEANELVKKEYRNGFDLDGWV
ncbi:MAG: Gfo/Idh/MocA family oxidoreductase, partial [Candidatus Omnitrophica bacterium]|nr:Gfo/Idh/MocA family oxidoreductase [Candidatus Omnitrophota bacterium]